MDTNTWRGTAELSLRAMRSDLVLARDHDAMRSTTELSTERWADWLLLVVRRGLIACAALQNYLSPHLSDEENAELAAASATFAQLKQVAVRAGAHLLPGDLPQGEE